MPVDLPNAVSGGGASTVDQNSAAGQNKLYVASTTGFAKGDKILIYKKEVGYKREIAEVDSVAAGDYLTLKDNLIYTHLATDAEAVTEVTLDTTDCLLTHKDNLIIGLHRDIKMETQRDAKLEGTIFFYSLRADVAVENLNACVLIKNLKVK